MFYQVPQMKDAPEALRKRIKKNAEQSGIFDSKNPTKLYCRVIIDYMAKVTGKSSEDLEQEILAYEALNQESK